MIITQTLAKKITQYEAKKEEVNIAQANEIVRVLSFILLEFSIEEIQEWIRKGTVKELIRLRKDR